MTDKIFFCWPAPFLAPCPHCPQQGEGTRSAPVIVVVAAAAAVADDDEDDDEDNDGRWWYAGLVLPTNRKMVTMSIINPTVHLLGDNGACIAYTRFTQYLDRCKSIKIQITLLHTWAPCKQPM